MNHYTVVTARKRSLRRLCFYTCLSVHRGGGIPACIVGVSRLTPRGEVEGSGQGGEVSRPTPKGEVEWSGWEGGGLPAHTQGES